MQKKSDNFYLNEHTTDRYNVKGEMWKKTKE